LNDANPNQHIDLFSGYMTAQIRLYMKLIN